MRRTCRKPESNRHGGLTPEDFKSSASTNSAIPARTSSSSLLNDFSTDFIKDSWKRQSDVGQYFSIQLYALRSNCTSKSTIRNTFCSNSSRQSLNPELSEFSLLFFSTLISMLSLFYQSSSYLLIYLASTKSKSFSSSEEFAMSSLFCKTVLYSNHDGLLVWD